MTADQTAADHQAAAREHVTAAIEHLQVIVKNEAPGADEYTQGQKDVLMDILGVLASVRGGLRG